MRDARLILPAGSRAHHMLSGAVQNCKAVVFAGLPGVGKTLLLQQTALLSHAAGRPLYLLQWDIARQGFETPGILARYPEVEGTTHAAIRRAAGFWVRGAVANWAAAHAGDDALLLGEAPFVGNRLIELARREADAAECFLAARTTLFIVPAPTLAVRRAIEATREREIVEPRHVREAANAPPKVLTLLMQELRAAGAALGVPGVRSEGGYDPEVYTAVYSRLLEHRHARALAIDECWPVVASPYELDVGPTELRPSPAEVADALARVEALGAVELERAVRQWYRHAAT
ncbi:MAG TPA: hypothetical protein VN325_08555 [Steroidobacteraceae bacterium]|nr:hypothetical protein [Steroidobacteraceae bacterium]